MDKGLSDEDRTERLGTVAPARPQPRTQAEAEDNAQTIRPTRSPRAVPPPLPRAASLSGMDPIVEDYSDLLGEEPEASLQEKVADFKVRTPSNQTHLLPFRPN